MDQIDRTLWIGAAEDGRAWERLRDVGISAVFNATHESDNWPPGFRHATPYLRLNQDDGVPIPAERLDRFAAFMFIHAGRGARFLIHCGAGVSRAATFTCVWLMLRDRVSWEVAEGLVRSHRPQIAPAPALRDSALAWLQGHQFWTPGGAFIAAGDPPRRSHGA